MPQLAVTHVKLVRQIAARVKTSLGVTAELDDLVGHGVLGLLAAESRYDENREASFATFAGYRIRGAMYDALPKVCRLARTESLGDGEGVGLAEHLRCPRRDAEAEAVANEQAVRVRRAMTKLSVRQRRLMIRVYFEGKDISRAGAELGISKSWASRVHADALVRLRKALLADER
jgi:RNA polymerase sigma factor FliA